MAERLREVPEQSPINRIILLRKQTDVIAEPQKTIEHSYRLGVAARQFQVISEPKSACQKGALAGRQTIDVRFSRIAHDITVNHELPLYGCHGAPHARIIRG